MVEQTESRLLCVTHWASSIGKNVLRQLSELYRALVWEGFILLAVAAGEDSASKSAGAEPRDEGSESQMSVQEADSAGEGQAMEVEGRVLAQPRRDPPTPHVTVAADPSAHVRVHVTVNVPGHVHAVAAGGANAQHGTSEVTSELSPLHSEQHPSILVESLKQLTPLLTITSRVGRSLAELMSLLIRLSTSPLHRTHRRGVGHPLIVHTYQEPAKEAIDVCMEVTHLLVDSLKWEVPMPQACSSAMQSPIRDWLFAG